MLGVECRRTEVSAMANSSRVETSQLTIRAWREQDVSTVYTMLREAAIVQHGEDDFCADPSTLSQDGFGSNPRVHCLVAELRKEIVGILLYFFLYSTWTSRTGLYVEDLYVRPDHRRQGIARALMSAAATVALNAGCPYIQWAILRNNSPAQRFYQSLGAVALSEWSLMRISGQQLEQLRAHNRAERIS